MGIETAITAAVGIGSALLQNHSSKAAYNAQKKASEEQAAQNELLLNQQKEANLLGNQTGTNTAQVESGGTAATSESEGYSGYTRQRRKRLVGTMSSTLGL